METGAGDPWIPTGWSNVNLDAGDTEAEIVVVHSGSGSVQYNASAADSESFRANPTLSSGNYACVGCFLYGNGSKGIKFRLEANQWTNQKALATFVDLQNVTTAWIHNTAVVRRIAGASNTAFLYGDGAGPIYADDFYIFALDDVSITATAASEANSAENSGVRVDGLDTLTQTIPAGSLGATSGKIRFKWRPRHGNSDLAKFGVSSPRLFEVAKDANNFIELRAISNTSVRMTIKVGGTGTDGSGINVSSDVSADTEYLIEVEYSATRITWSLDSVVKDTITPGAGIDFGANIPDTFYSGSDRSSINQSDAVYINP